jgi:hypothetical protein
VTPLRTWVCASSPLAYRGQPDTLADLAPAIERPYRVLGEDGSWCLLTTEFQLYTMRGGMRANEFGEIYQSYRRRLGGLIAHHFDRLGIETSLTPYEFGGSQTALSHKLALPRAANGSLKKNLPARALATFVRGALAAGPSNQ